ncbi:MAG: HD domain-containing protein [Thermomicrobiales bacterium]
MPAKTLFASDIEANMNVDSAFLVRNVERKMTKPNKFGDSKPFLALELADRTGVVTGRVWSENMPFVESVLQKNAVVQVIGTTQAYGNEISLVITDATAVEGADLTEYVPSSPRERAGMVQEYAGLADTVAAADLHQLLTVFMASAFFDEFVRAPAAHVEAYAYLGGLLEHTLNVAQLALGIATTRTDVDADLLLTAALLHDIGKVDAYEPLTFTQSVDGQLLDHTALTLIRLDRLVDEAGGLGDEARRQLYHAIATHEQRGFSGAPPQTKEAVVLQACNQLDTTLAAASHSSAGDGPWSDTVRSLRRRFYRGTPDGDRPADMPRPATPAAAAAAEQPRSIWDDPAADDLDAEIPF